MDKDKRRQDKHTSSVIKKGKFVIKKREKYMYPNNWNTNPDVIRNSDVVKLSSSVRLFLMVLICDFVSFEVMCMQILENVVIDIINE